MTNIFSVESFSICFLKNILFWCRVQTKQMGGSFGYMRATEASKKISNKKTAYHTISYMKVV